MLESTMHVSDEETIPYESELVHLQGKIPGLSEASKPLQVGDEAEPRASRRLSSPQAKRAQERKDADMHSDRPARLTEKGCRRTKSFHSDPKRKRGGQRAKDSTQTPAIPGSLVPSSDLPVSPCTYSTITRA